MFREAKKLAVKVMDSFVQSLIGCCVHSDVFAEMEKKKKKKKKKEKRRA